MNKSISDEEAVSRKKQVGPIIHRRHQEKDQPQNCGGEDGGIQAICLDAAILLIWLHHAFYSTGSPVADDLLSALLTSVTQARKELTSINADNAPLAALQAVLQSWVNQVQSMPKKLQTITETDLDAWALCVYETLLVACPPVRVGSRWALRIS
jgi:hypothetical protein